MKKTNFPLTLLLVVAVAVVPSVPAQAATPDTGNNKIEFNCAKREPAGASQFKDLEKLALDINAALCKRLLTVDGRAEDSAFLLGQFSIEAEDILIERFEAAGLRPAIADQFSAFREHVDRMPLAIENYDYPSLEAEYEPAELYFTVTEIARSQIPDNNDANCKSISGPNGTLEFDTCSGALKDAARAFNNYKQALANFRIDSNKPKLGYMSSQWKRYLNEGRSQTLVDVWATSAVFGRYLSQDRLVGPPPAQLFLFRPQAVFEYNRDTKKGDRNQLGLAVEWAGINFWNAKIPWGLSAISVYADYEEEDSLGHGIQLTINNSTSIGWVDRGETNGTFMSLDLLKVIENKDARFERFKKDPFAWIKNDD